MRTYKTTLVVYERKKPATKIKKSAKKKNLRMLSVPSD